MPGRGDFRGLDAEPSCGMVRTFREVAASAAGPFAIARFDRSTPGMVMMDQALPPHAFRAVAWKLIQGERVIEGRMPLAREVRTSNTQRRNDAFPTLC